MSTAVGRLPNSAWELGVAENVFRESFLEKVTHKLYLEKFSEFSEGKSRGKMFPPQGTAFAKTQRQKGDGASESSSLICSGWRSAV